VLYDYSVYAGTQSAMNHAKISRMFLHAEKASTAGDLLARWRRRATARHARSGAALDRKPSWCSRACPAWCDRGISPGRAFAGHANLAGLCDRPDRDEDSAMGMAGRRLSRPPLAKNTTPEEIGPASVHWASGVIDVLVKDETEAIAAAQKYLSYFDMEQVPGEAPDQMLLRDIVPENPRRAYNVRTVIQTFVRPR